MSVHEKRDFWSSKFKIALPYKLAVHFITQNRERIEKDFLSICTEHAALWTHGKYGRSDIGSYVVRMSGYVQEILKSLDSESGPIGKMLFHELSVDPPSTNYEFWRKMKLVDPDHPAFHGELWCQEIALELGEVIGEYLNGCKLKSAAIYDKFNEIQRSSRGHKQIATVMES